MILLVLLNLIVTAFLSGLIWFVQVVHYPIFQKVGQLDFKKFHQAHTYTTGQVVILPMLIELVLSFILIWSDGVMFGERLIAFVLVIFVWIVTAVSFVPLHSKLSEDASEELLRKLVRRNMLRTLLWSVRLILLTYIIFQLIKSSSETLPSGM